MKVKKIILLILVIIMVSSMSINAFAVELSDGESVSINDDSVKITESGTYIITGTGVATNNRIFVDPDIIGEVNITIDNVNIDNSLVTNDYAFLIGAYTHVNLTISNDNILKSGINSAGLCVPPGASININGTGSLTAIGKGDVNGGGAGIGGYSGIGSGEIVISGGTINATGGENAAGIGGGYIGSCDIKIEGGIITAIGGEDAAGIGNGMYGDGGNIIISGGTINASSSVDGGAGIGSGYGYHDDRDLNGTNITISGGIITASGNNKAAGIGAGQHMSNGIIIISGTANVKAYGGIFGAGIGIGDGGLYGGSITINDNAVVTAIGGAAGAGIDSDNTIINGGFIKATGGLNQSGIGDVNINGGIIHAIGGKDAAGIGGGFRETAIININGGEVYAEAGIVSDPINYNTSAAIGSGGYFKTNPIGDSTVNVSSPSAVFTKIHYNIFFTSSFFMSSTNILPVISSSAHGYHNFPESWEGEEILGYIPLEIPTLIVSFITSDDNDIPNQTITHSQKVVEPQVLTKDNFEFAGWYKTAEYKDGDIWDFDVDLVTESITLYAKWNAITYSVSFETTSGSAVTSQTIMQGSKVIKPNDPSKDNNIFGGWYKTAEFKDVDIWDFDADLVTETTTLYAKWDAVTYLVSFETTSGSAVTSQKIIEGAKAIKPSDPSKDNNIFAGWYTSIDCNDDDRWNFNTTTIFEDIVLYAKWTAEGVNDIPNTINRLIIKSKYATKIPYYILGRDEVFLIKSDGVKVSVNGLSLAAYKDNEVELFIQRIDKSYFNLDIDGNFLEDMYIFDISILVDGIKMPFSSDTALEIVLDVEGDYDNHKMVAIYISDDGSYEILKGIYDGDAMRFKTNHLSNYALIYVDKTFDDIANHWGKEAIEALASRGIINGVGNDRFNPEEIITRAQFTAMMVRYFELSSETTDKYSDVKEEDWYADDARIAKANGILADMYNDIFDGDQAISREEMMFILYKSLEVTDMLTMLDDNGDMLSDFTDNEKVSNYAKEGCEYLISRDIINGSGDGMFKPKETSTRAETAQMMWNMMQLLSE